MNKRTYTPFLRPQKVKHIDGVYRHKKSGNLIRLRNMWIRGFIDCEIEPNEPYDAYQGEVTQEGRAPIKKCSIEPYVLTDEYEKIF